MLCLLARARALLPAYATPPTGWERNRHICDRRDGAYHVEGWGSRISARIRRARGGGLERVAPPSRANPGVSAIRPVPSVYRARSQGVVALIVRRVAQRYLRESRALVP